MNLTISFSFFLKLLVYGYKYFFYHMYNNAFTTLKQFKPCTRKFKQFFKTTNSWL